MGLHDADHNVFAARVAANRFAEHAVSLADTRRVTEKKLEAALCLFRRGSNFEPILGLFWQSTLQIGYGRKNPRPEYDKINLCDVRPSSASCLPLWPYLQLRQSPRFIAK